MQNSRFRQVIAVTLLATALCADRAIAAAPVVNQQIAAAAGRVVSRLATQFRRTVPAFSAVEVRNELQRPAEQRPALPRDMQTPEPFAFSPFEFRLPPPAAA